MLSGHGDPKAMRRQTNSDSVPGGSAPNGLDKKGCFHEQKKAPPTGSGGAVKILHEKSGLMFETPLPGIDHCRVGLIACFDGLVVVLRSAGTDNR
jgi:hypothetical protein